MLSTSNRSGNQTSCATRTSLEGVAAWSYKFVTWFSSQFNTGEDALEWTKSRVVEILNAEITATSTTSGMDGFDQDQYTVASCFGVTWS